MNKIIFLLFALVFYSCNQNNNETTSNSLSEKDIFEETDVAILYLYGKMRCASCIDLQALVSDVANEEFSNNDKVNHYEIDFSKKQNQAIADKYEVSFSSLIIAKQDEHIDLTMEAFDLLHSDPQALKELIINETNNLLTN